MAEKETKIIFMGTPEFAVPCFEALVESGWNVVAAITNPDKPAGRKKILTPPPVKIAAQKRGVPILQPANLKNPEIAAQIKTLSPDLLVVCAYGKMLPREILEIPRLGTINVHASLLPRWRGASPIQFAILAGDEKTGITIMEVNEKMDEGGIFSQETVEISENDDALTLGEKLAKLGAKSLVETLPKIISGKLKPRPQDDFVKIWGEPTYCKILKREDGKINWSKSAEEIGRQIRAFAKEPGSFFVFKRGEKSLEIKALRAKVAPCPKNAPLENGKTFLAKKGEVGIKTGNGCLELLELQPQGKNPMEAKNFLNGYPDFVGANLE